MKPGRKPRVPKTAPESDCGANNSRPTRRALGFGRHTASKETTMAIDRHKRPFAFTMRWGLMAFAAIVLVIALGWAVAVAV